MPSSSAISIPGQQDRALQLHTVRAKYLKICKPVI